MRFDALTRVAVLLVYLFIALRSPPMKTDATDSVDSGGGTAMRHKPPRPPPPAATTSTPSSRLLLSPSLSMQCLPYARGDESSPVNETMINGVTPRIAARHAVYSDAAFGSPHCGLTLVCAESNMLAHCGIAVTNAEPKEVSFTPEAGRSSLILLHVRNPRVHAVLLEARSRVAITHTTTCATAAAAAAAASAGGADLPRGLPSRLYDIITLQALGGGTLTRCNRSASDSGGVSSSSSSSRCTHLPLRHAPTMQMSVMVSDHKLSHAIQALLLELRDGTRCDATV